MPLRSEVGALETTPCRIHDAGNWQIAWGLSGAAMLPLQHCLCWGLVFRHMLVKSSSFPEGFYHPICSLARWSAPRWFSAIPEVVWEGALLAYLLHCIARGG